jgi:hypothetical protein
MAIVPQPHRPVDLILGGGQAIGQGLTAYADRQAQTAKDNAPGDEALDRYFDRLMRGEDPQKLAQEAKYDPALQLVLGRAQGGPSVPAPGGYVPDVGTPGGQPAVLPPGTVNPYGAPGAPVQQQATPPQSGLMGPPPPQASGMSLGDYGRTQHAANAQAIGGFNPQPMQGSGLIPSREMPAQGGFPGYSVGPTGPLQGLANDAAMPMSGAPNVPKNVSPPPQAAPPREQPPRPYEGGTPPTPGGSMGGGQRRTVAEQQRLMGIMPAMIAGASREDVARTQADARRDVSETNALKGLAIAAMKDASFDDDSIRKYMASLEGMDLKAQIAALNATIGLAKARIGADATLGSAQTRAATKEDPAEKELRTSIGSLAAITSKPEWTKDAASVAEFNRLTARVGELQRGLGREGQSTPAPISGPPSPGANPNFGGPTGPSPKQPAPAQKPNAPAGQKLTPSGKPYVKMQKNAAGQIRYLDAAGNVVK